MHITILLTFSVPPGEEDAHLHPEPPGSDKHKTDATPFYLILHNHIFYLKAINKLDQGRLYLRMFVYAYYDATILKSRIPELIFCFLVGLYREQLLMVLMGPGCHGT